MLTAIRKRKGLSQKDIAKKCRWSQQRVSQIEAGDIGLVSLEKYLNALSIGLKDFFKNY